MICFALDSLSRLLGEYIKARPMTASSAEQLTVTANLFARWYEQAHQAPFHPMGFSEPLINDFLNAMVDAKRFGPTTANNKRRHLLTLWKFATSREIVEPYKHERIARYKEPTIVPTAYLLDELDAFLDACPRTKFKRPVPGWDWRSDRALALAIYDTAFRIEATLQLLKPNLRSDGAILALYGSQKTFADEARWFGPTTMAAIRLMPPSDDPRVFPYPFGAEYLVNRWKHIQRTAGLPTTRRDGPQKMRRTSASHLEANRRGSGKAHLGHKTPGLAEKHYFDPRIVRAEKAHEVMPKVGLGQTKMF